jgi:hypothetical protein
MLIVGMSLNFGLLTATGGAMRGSSCFTVGGVTGTFGSGGRGVAGFDIGSGGSEAGVAGLVLGTLGSGGSVGSGGRVCTVGASNFVSNVETGDNGLRGGGGAVMISTGFFLRKSNTTVHLFSSQLYVQSYKKFSVQKHL